MSATGELELCCNVVQCRQRLVNSGKAVVTTCSHIFCVSCANRTFSRALVCPACDSSLTAPDDIVFQTLNPSQDYKSSCLAGLAPDIVMDIASRAISFYSYQIGQEQCFQDIMYKNLEEKAVGLESQVDNVMRDATAEIKQLRAQFQAIKKEQEMAKRKLHDTNENLQEKNRQYQKLQSLYDKLKSKSQRDIAKTRLLTDNVASNSCSQYNSGVYQHRASPLKPSNSQHIRSHAVAGHRQYSNANNGGGDKTPFNGGTSRVNTVPSYAFGGNQKSVKNLAHQFGGNRENSPSVFEGYNNTSNKVHAMMSRPVAMGREGEAAAESRRLPRSSSRRRSAPSPRNSFGGDGASTSGEALFGPRNSMAAVFF